MTSFNMYDLSAFGAAAEEVVDRTKPTVQLVSYTDMVTPTTVERDALPTPEFAVQPVEPAPTPIAPEAPIEPTMVERPRESVVEWQPVTDVDVAVQDAAETLTEAEKAAIRTAPDQEAAIQQIAEQKAQEIVVRIEAAPREFVPVPGGPATGPIIPPSYLQIPFEHRSAFEAWVRAQWGMLPRLMDQALVLRLYREWLQEVGAPRPVMGPLYPEPAPPRETPWGWLAAAAAAGALLL